MAVHSFRDLDRAGGVYCLGVGQELEGMKAMNDDPRCPNCRSRMNYEDDRDEDGNLLQRPWWDCNNCGHKIPLTNEECLEIGIIPRESGSPNPQTELT